MLRLFSFQSFFLKTFIYGLRCQLNSLWSNDATWVRAWYPVRSVVGNVCVCVCVCVGGGGGGGGGGGLVNISVQVMVMLLNRCWFFNSEVQWHSFISFNITDLTFHSNLPGANELTHWGRVTHICVSKLTIIVSDNGSASGQRQTIIWTNAGILLIRTLGTNFSEVLIAIHTFSF